MYLLPPKLHLHQPVSLRLKSVPVNLVAHAGHNHRNIIIKPLAMTPGKGPVARTRVHMVDPRIGAVTEA